MKGAARGWRIHRVICDVCDEGWVRTGISKPAVHSQQGGIFQVVEAEAGPGPLVGGGNQAALHGVPVHVFQLLQALPLAPDVEIIEPPLPDPRGAVKVHRGRQCRAVQHPAAPRELTILTEVVQDEDRRPLLEALDDFRGVRSLAGPDE